MFRHLENISLRDAQRSWKYLLLLYHSQYRSYKSPVSLELSDTKILWVLNKELFKDVETISLQWLPDKCEGVGNDYQHLRIFLRPSQAVSEQDLERGHAHFIRGNLFFIFICWQCKLLHTCVLLVISKHLRSKIRYQKMKEKSVSPDETVQRDPHSSRTSKGDHYPWEMASIVLWNWNPKS